MTGVQTCALPIFLVLKMKVLIVIVAVLLAYVSAATVFYDDFRNINLRQAGWTSISGKSSLTANGLSISAQQHFGPDLIKDCGADCGPEKKYTITSRMKIAKGGAGHCIKFVSNSPKKFFCYFLYAQNRIYVSTNGGEGDLYSNSQQPRFKYNTWFTLSSVVDGYSLNVLVDGKSVWAGDLRKYAGNVQGSTKVGISYHSGASALIENFAVTNEGTNLKRHQEHKGILSLLQIMENKINKEKSELETALSTRAAKRAAAITAQQKELEGYNAERKSTEQAKIAAEGRAALAKQQSAAEGTKLNTINGKIAGKKTDINEMTANNNAAATADNKEMSEFNERYNKEIKLIALIRKLVIAGKQ